MKNQAICLFIVLLLAAPGQADVIFDTFGPGDTYGLPLWPIGWNPDDADTANQFSFSGTTEYSLDTIELAVTLDPFGLDIFKISLQKHFGHL